MKPIIVLVCALAAVSSARLPRYETKALPGYFLCRPDLVPTCHDSAHAYDIRYYQIHMNLAMVNAAMSAWERVTVTSRIPGLDTVTLHMINLYCDSVRIAGNPASFTTPPGLLTIHLDRQYNTGESLTIDIYYHRDAGTPQQGFYWYSKGTTGFHALAYSTTEPSDARGWFPCFDEPWDKAEQGCAIAITVPDSFAACSNGLLDSVTTNPTARTKTFWWRGRYPIATYLMTFAASRWITLTQWARRGANDSLMIQNFIWPEDSIHAAAAFARNVAMMDFFTSRYGPYPFDKYGMVEAYPFPWGGMENQEMTMIHHYWVVYGSDNGIAHELSHQWWGDMVTCLDWRNIWLNEGFATYSDELYEYHQNGRNAFISLINNRANAYFDSDALHRFPLYAPAMVLESLFDWGHIYCKAAWVQHMLRYVLEDTIFDQPGIFFHALRAYGDSFRYGNANTDDYCRILEQVTGRELSWFFDEWVYQAGYPNYTINWHSLPVGPYYQVNLDIAQSNGALAPDCFHMPLQLKIRLTTKDTVVTIPITSNPQSASFTVSANATVLFSDPGNWLLEKTTFRVGVENATAAELAQPLAVVPSIVRDRCNIRYTLPAAGPADLSIYDAAGRKVRQLIAGNQRAGTHHIYWNGGDAQGQRLAPGIYFCRLDLAGCDPASLGQQIKLILTE